MYGIVVCIGTRIWKHLMTELLIIVLALPVLLHVKKMFRYYYRGLWGIGSESPFHKPNRKVSVIGVNSKRGFDFLNECKSLVLEKRNWSEAVAGNSQLRAPLPKSSQYDLFWEKYHKYGIDAAFKATVYKKVCKRYRREYPILLLKNIIKKCIHYGK